MALPARVFWTLENLAARWGCDPDEIVGWATEGFIEIVTSIGMVQCSGTETLVGLVAVCAEDIMPLFRGNRLDSKACMIWRIRPQGTATWKIITVPAQGVTIELDDLLVTARTAQRFEDEYDPLHRVHVSPGRSLRHDWDPHAARCAIGPVNHGTSDGAGIRSNPARLGQPAKVERQSRPVSGGGSATAAQPSLGRKPLIFIAWPNL